MSMTKAFVQVFTKEVIASPKKIEEFEGIPKDDYKVGEGVNVSGFVESNESILFITISGKKELHKPSVYIEMFTNCNLIKNQNIADKKNVYFLVYKTKDKYVVFERKDKEFAIKPGYRLAQFSNEFSNAETINNTYNIRKDMADAIQNAWSGLGIGSDKRMQFIILTWVMLTHDDIPFSKFADGTVCSLREYFERVESVCSLWETAGGKGYSEGYDQYKHIGGKDLLNAFGNVITYKMKTHHGEHNKDAMKYVLDNQERKFKSVVEALDTTKANQNALAVAGHLYNYIYKQYGAEVDMCKIVFDLEQKWNNRTIGATVAQKGQIYTHTMMKDLIMRLFSKNIKNNATCYDPTCGTGGFTDTFHKYAFKHKLKNVIAYGNEIDEDCSNMAWVAGFCSDIDVRIFNEDCFDPVIKHKLIPARSIDYLLMNPPYGMNKGKLNKVPSNLDWDEDVDLRKPEDIKLTEWTFCRYNLESFVKPGGWFAFVIPVSCVSENKQNTLDKSRLIDNAEIWFVIRIREDIFTPQAGKACCLVIGRWLPGMRTIKEKKHWRTKCIDFSQDSGEIKRKKGEVEYDKDTLRKLQNERIFDNKVIKYICEQAGGVDSRLKSIKAFNDDVSSEWYEERKLKPEDNWLYTRREKTDLSKLKGKFKMFIEDRRHERVASLIHQEDVLSLAKPDHKDCEWRDVNIMDVFEYFGKGKINSLSNSNDGPYPCISCSAYNNGASKCIDIYDYDTEELGHLLITVPGDGDIYKCFVQKGKFSAQTSVHILKPKDIKQFTEDDLVKIAFLMSERFGRGAYNYHLAKLNKERLQKETVSLPFNKQTNKIDMNMTSLFDLQGSETIKDVRVGEIFEFVGRGKYNVVKDVPVGKYPLISCSGHNNGIVSYVDKYDYDGTYLSIATNGDATAGIVFVQRGKFTTTTNMLILKLKQEYEYLEECLSSLAFAMTQTFRHRYNYSHVLTQERLMNEVIPDIPFIQDVNDKSKMIIDVTGLRYIYI